MKRHSEFTHLPVPVYQIYEPNLLLPSERDEFIGLACAVNMFVFDSIEDVLVSGFGLYKEKHPLLVIHFYVEGVEQGSEEFQLLYYSYLVKTHKLSINYHGRDMQLVGPSLEDVKVNWFVPNHQTGLPGYLHDEDVNIVLGHPVFPQMTVFWDD